MKRKRRKNQKIKRAAGKTEENLTQLQSAKNIIEQPVRIQPPKDGEKCVESAIKEPKNESSAADQTESKPFNFIDRVNSFGQKYHKVLNTILIIIISVIALWFTDYFNAEKKAVALFYTLSPQNSSNILIVEIGDNDYQQFFKSQSPLDVHVLERILKAILLGKPKVVGVDIDTSDERFAELTIPDEDSIPPIVWATAPKLTLDGAIHSIPNPLGSKKGNRDYNEGIAVFPQDTETNSLCCYQRFVEIVPGETEETFAWKIFSIYNEESRTENKSTQRYYLRLEGTEQNSRRTVFSAQQLLEMSADANWQDNSPLKDKIVIFGGSYIGQEDIKPTYNGNYKGYELHAAAIETEINGNLLQPTPLVGRIFIMIVYCFLTIAVFHIFEKRFFLAVMISIGVFLVLSIFLSFLRYGSCYGIIQYLPALIYMLIAKIADYLYYKESLIKMVFKPFHQTKNV